AVADEWVPIRPGTDGLLALSLVHVLLARERFDWEFLVRYTNAPFLVVQTPGEPGDGLLLRDENGRPLLRDGTTERFVDGLDAGSRPLLFGQFSAPDGRPVKTVMTLIAERYLDPAYAPERVAAHCGVPASTIERLALELAHAAFEQAIEIDCEWTDWAGRRHDKFIGRPVSMHAMRGISAHSNGFQTCRALHLLQTLLGTIDVPGGHRAKPPFPRHIPPPVKPARTSHPDTPLNAPPLGFPTGPEDLVIDDRGRPLRIDKAYSWEAPLANHGLMHRVISNAVAGDPYPIDTLILFMANMAWNSTMNTREVQDLLCAKDADGEYRIPFLVVVDAFDSETVHFADLVLPDTTYLERFDAISLLDRPISEPDAVCDAIRQPVLAPERDVRPWQEVLVDLGGRLGLPAFVDEQGQPKYQGYTDFIARWEKAPGIGFLAGWRGTEGDTPLRGAPNPDQWQRYIDHQCFFRHELPEHLRFYRYANRDYLDWAVEAGFNASREPIVLELYSETLQRFRLAGQCLYDGPRPEDPHERERLVRYFDPLPFWYRPLEDERSDGERFPLHAITQRPMHMYHSWDSQNAWLRQVTHQNFLYMNRARAEREGIEDLGWVWLESPHGRIRVQVRLMEGCEEHTVWTWNAIGKQAGAWGLEPDAPEVQRGFLLNLLISELLPPARGEPRWPNTDPVTGQAAWYDLKVRITPAAAGETGFWPPLPALRRLDDTAPGPARLRYQTHPAVNLRRSLHDILGRP
ncbi:MAG: molybdopterin-dependent oxidoreductase, partial [Candidatus Competibacterales bacterium]|nr:molybdopterin-dependent oxidoreductase [Candidatus Competibacterales bacterium]